MFNLALSQKNPVLNKFMSKKTQKNTIVRHYNVPKIN